MERARAMMNFVGFTMEWTLIKYAIDTCFLFHPVLFSIVEFGHFD